MIWRWPRCSPSKLPIVTIGAGKLSLISSKPWNTRISRSASLELEAALVDLRVDAIERVVLASAGTKVAVDAAVWEILRIVAQERARVHELAAGATAVALALAGGLNGLLDVIAVENR